MRKRTLKLQKNALHDEAENEINSLINLQPDILNKPSLLSNKTFSFLISFVLLPIEACHPICPRDCPHWPANYWRVFIWTKKCLLIIRMSTSVIYHWWGLCKALRVDFHNDITGRKDQICLIFEGEIYNLLEEKNKQISLTN